MWTRSCGQGFALQLWEDISKGSTRGGWGGGVGTGAGEAGEEGEALGAVETGFGVRHRGMWRCLAL